MNERTVPDSSSASAAPTSGRFELLLFSTDVTMVDRAVSAGVDGIIVDWERHGKDARQSGSDTEINSDTHEDLRRVRQATAAPVICRVNGPADSTAEEIETAIACGATELLVPMVRTPDEVERILGIVAGRLGVGILIETIAGVACAADLARLPVTRVYVGLNDLAIERRAATIFDAVVDGTIEELRPLFSVPFGFGGLTRPDGGHPVPCRLLMGEMARLDCAFSFLRRSFHRDVRGRPLEEGVGAIRKGLADAFSRPDEDVARDREALRMALLPMRSAC